MDQKGKMKLANYITHYLNEIGVKNVFMLSGTGSIHLDDAFAHQDDMGYICARHEAAAALMAVASAKLTGNIGVIIATTGPGGTNADSAKIAYFIAKPSASGNSKPVFIES